MANTTTDVEQQQQQASTCEEVAKSMKLWIHKRGEHEKYGLAEVVLNARDYVQPDDLLELYHAGDGGSHVLLQYKSLAHNVHVEFTHKDTVSVEQGIASQFRLKNYNDVMLRRVRDLTQVYDYVCTKYYVLFLLNNSRRLTSKYQPERRRITKTKETK